MFQTYYSGSKLPSDDFSLNIVHICYLLHMNYFEFMRQPAWFIGVMLAYIEGKGRAEIEKAKKRKS